MAIAVDNGMKFASPGVDCCIIVVVGRHSFASRKLLQEQHPNTAVVQYPFVNTLHISWRPHVEYATRITTYLDYRGLQESQGNHLFVSL